ncbi:MAG: hypothetical protein WDW38_009982 [Sanguina aurantia]
MTVNGVGAGLFAVARTAAVAGSSSLDFFYRNVMGSGSNDSSSASPAKFDIIPTSSPAHVTTSTGHACKLLQNRRSSRTSSRTQAKIMRVHQGMTTGFSKCCLPQTLDFGQEDFDFSSSGHSLASAANADWQAQQWNAQLGLQSSMM